MTTPSSTISNQRTVSALAPLMAVVLVAFLIIGIALPVLPLHVHDDLKLGTFFVGLVTGSQFAASLFSRVWAGHFADKSGAKLAVIVGMVSASVAGLFYLSSLVVASMPLVSVTILIVGRAVLGAAESFIITGALSWGLARVHAGVSGKVIAWIGMAMYAAFALGAPLGTVLYAKYGFSAIAFATVLMPLATLTLVLPMNAIAPLSRSGPSMTKVIRAVAAPGVGLAMSSIGFGSIMAFVSLLFVERGWQPAWLSFTVFAISFIAARVVFGHLPDKLGGAKVALIFVLIEAAGQALIWAATSSAPALLGAAMTGIGYSLVYPALGVEAVHRVPPQNRGLAMGAYTAFLDLALGIASPVLGLLAHWAGLRMVFLVAAMIACGSAGVSVALMRAAGRR
ncbi:MULTISPECIES: arabinose transporter [unclassified Burkholderia]|uniref:arabinose transporter n=1 Tax=unclassified Burkholderia TaxID=2613784 RepID=UPI000F5762A8|nr:MULTISPECIES: arabinose transporter [unclassified Burkholderia]RQS24809.1 MFS transporter [Burkholderia sp. Bp8995]RQS43196.1 MFS transporter [Burkholderia sp. Bp8989]